MDIAGHAERIVRLRDGKVVSDFLTREDPIHREYLGRMAVAAAELAKGDAEVEEKRGGGVEGNGSRVVVAERPVTKGGAR